MLREMVVRRLASQSRTKGRLGGQNPGFIAVCHVGGAPEVAKACMLSIHRCVSWIMPEVAKA
jgi:hypothetical protein